MNTRRCALWLCVSIPIVLAGIGALGALGVPAWQSTRAAAVSPRLNSAPNEYAGSDIEEAARRVNRVFEQAWEQAGVRPAAPADPIIAARRLSLALCGTIPSLEEIRYLEKLPADQQVNAHLDRLLDDRRYADYMAERLSRAFVGTDQGPFLIYRRRRFVYWLSDELAKNRRYDELVRELVAAEGIWTDKPASNFLTATAVDKGPDPLRLAARTTRAFLGVRIDCAQCHDHPFAEWKQEDFEGLAAYFAQAKQTITGVEDKDGELRIEDATTKEEREVAPRLPFGDLVSTDGRRREQLAQWITSPTNRYFAEAIANRMWTLLFGKGIVEPVDDLEAELCVPGVLETLADDFRSNGHDLRRLIRVIAATRAFRMSSASDEPITEEHERLHAVFPLTRLRSEQIAGSLMQVSSLHTIDAESHIFLRFLRLVNTADFIKHYGDAGEDELNAHMGTIPQRLVMLNGKMPRERIEAGPFQAAGRINTLAPSDESRVRISYLVCLSRLPSPDEQAHFVERLKGLKAKQRGEAIEDMLWALCNSTEFSWNH